MPSLRCLLAIAAILSVLLLGGCALAPGAHIDYEAPERVAAIEDLEARVEILPITPELVAGYRQVMPTARPMSSELQQALAGYTYRVGPGDVLSITVYDHPELTIPAGGQRSAEEVGHVVRHDGSIFYPYIGRLQVAGKGVAEIRDELGRRLATYLTEPQVDVRVAAFNSQKIYVTGAVTSPGSQPVTVVPKTLVDAISQAGGALDSADWHEVIFNRNGREERLSLYAILSQGDQHQNRLLRDGDVVHVPSAANQVISVMGQVRRPGNVLPGNEWLSLTGAIARVGGLSEETAEPTGIFVVRGHEQGSAKLATVYQLDISNATTFSMGSDFPLEPHDVVYVTTAPLGRWNRVISLLLPSLVLPGNVAESATDVNDL